MATKTMKIIIALTIIIGLSVIATAYIVCCSHSQEWGHPHPSRTEVYEWRDPDSNEPVIRAVFTKWTGDSRSLDTLMFKGMHETVWYIDFDPLSLADPQKSWLVCRDSLDVESLNFADDPDGISDYGNPYLFTGRRVDMLDNGGLNPFE